MHHEQGEVKFVCAIWILFSYDPGQVKPQDRLKLNGWMSSAHWNGHLFRSGEYMQQISELTEEEKELREESEGEDLAGFFAEFGHMVLQVESVCKPRMLQHQQRLLEKKATILARVSNETESPVA